VNETIRQYWERTTQYWNQFNRTQKIMFGSVVLFIILTFTLSIYLFSKTEYSIAYTDLNATDAAAIREYLNTEGIPYEFSSDGTALLVPTKNATQVKIDVESQNMLNGGSIGFGIFRDNISNFGMTDSQFEVLYTDGRGGEVEQLINGMDGVRRSKVLLTIPKQSVFLNANDPEQASASVVVSFKPGFKVTQPFIDTIYNLVSKSVSNLPLENITITNQENEMLPSSRINGGIENATNAASQQFLIKKQYEVDVRKNVESFLGRIMGPDKIIVNVVSTLNFDQKNRQEILFTPVNTIDQTGIERSVQEIQKSYSSEGADSTGGVPGTGDGDIPGYPGGANSGGTVNSEEVERIINYEVNEITNSIVSSPFVVEDLTIFAGIEPFIADDPESLTEETKNQIHSMLVNIIGTSLANSGKTFSQEELNSKVSVIAQPFYGKRDVFGESSNSSYLLYGIGAIAVLLAAAGGYYFAFMRRKSPEIIEEELEATPQGDYPSIDFETVSQDNQVRKQLESLAKKKPDEFVDLLRTWLADE
jgi:flagellar M-ring protein FliF